MKFIWIEILKFIKNNLIKLLIGIGAITVLFIIITSRSKVAEPTLSEEGTTEYSFEIDSRPANFRFYIENHNGTVFTNNTLLEQYITQSNILQEASSITNTQLFKLVQENENKALVNYTESAETKIIGVTKDSNSILHEFYVNIGNESDNLKIARYFFDYLTKGNVDFINDKNIYEFHHPMIKEITQELSFESEDSVEKSNSNLFQNIILGIILGFVFTAGVLLFVTFVSKKLIYSFSYSVREKDYYLLIDNRLNNENELFDILNTKVENQVVISEHGLSKVSGNGKFNKLATKSYKSLLEIPDLKNIDRLIYIIEENETTRYWYNNQRRMDKAYNAPTAVIQINK